MPLNAMGLRAAGFTLAIILVVASGLPVEAATSPFGIAVPDGGGGGFGGPLAPLFAWIAQRQAEFYRLLTGALADIKENGWAVWLLLGVSFSYGVFHAAGPGHGKAVISAYMLASGESIRRGVAISFGAAFIQALTAIAIVAVATIIFRVTAQTMTEATLWIEIVSYALIALLGAWLLWAKVTGRGHHHHRPDDHHHRHEHGSPAKDGAMGAWPAMLAVGIRPCSGALIVLVFALAQGLFVAGIAATFMMALGTGLTVAVLAAIAVSAHGLAAHFAAAESQLAGGLLKALEIAAAAAVLLFGLLLLGGALSQGLPG